MNSSQSKLAALICTLLFGVICSAANAQSSVIPGFPDSVDGGSTGGAAAGSTGGYYKLPNGDLIGPDGKPIPASENPYQDQSAQPSRRLYDQSQRVSPPSKTGQNSYGSPRPGQQGGEGDAFSARVQQEINRTPEVVYNPNGTATVKPLPDMRDPFALSEEVLVPLTPEQIRAGKRVYQEEQKAKAMPFMGEMPKPVSTQVVLDLSPNATPPVVRVIPGSGSVVSFRDVTGAAWPVISYQSFNGVGFTVSQPIAGSNMITVAATKNYGVGNLAVVLKGFPTPIILSTLSSTAKEIDAKLDIQIPVKGPNAIESAIPTRSPTGKDLLDALYGILPSGSKQIDVEGAQAKAWITASGDLIITGALQVVSPAPLERTGLGDGFYAYRMSLTRVVLATQNGTERKLVLKERK